MPITRITSRTNPLIVSIASLHEKKYRDTQRLFLLEGKKLFTEALMSDLSLRYILFTEQMLPFCLQQLRIRSEADCEDSRLICVSESVLEKISTEKSPQGVICVAQYLDKLHFFDTINSEKILPLSDKTVFALSSVRDPGNLGTILRTARAFGTDLLLLSADCADLYNPRTVRSAMGTLFRQRICVVPDLQDAITQLREQGKRVYAAMLDENAISLSSFPTDKSTVFLVGNEGHGIDPSIAACCNGSVMIPMAKDSAESLNAAIASAILLWHSFSS